MLPYICGLCLVDRQKVCFLVMLISLNWQNPCSVNTVIARIKVLILVYLIPFQQEK